MEGAEEWIGVFADHCSWWHVAGHVLQASPGYCCETLVSASRRGARCTDVLQLNETVDFDAEVCHSARGLCS
jgi:hypothetical protein